MSDQPSALPVELQSCHAKLDRAQERLNDLATAINEWREPLPYALVREDQPETDEYADHVYRVQVLRAPPLDWSITIGEILYDIHSALDHLANRLAEREGHSRRITFPIFKNRAKFWRKNKDGTAYLSQSGAAALMLMPEEAKSLIVEIQPYECGNQAPRHPLWLLHELSNADKHHALHLVGTALVDTKLWADTNQDAIAELRSIKLGPFDDSDEIGTVRVWKTGPNPAAQLKAQFATEEAFAQLGPAAGEHPVRVLNRIVIYVLKEIFVARFEPYFRA